MNWRNVIDSAELKRINEKYINDIKSLDKTARWVGQEYGVVVSRSQLTNAFRSKNLEVRKANGRTDEEYVPINKYRSPVSEFASAIIGLALKDIQKYISGKGVLINYLSACHLLTTDFYDALIDTLKEASPWTEKEVGNARPVPYGMTLEMIQNGAELYMDQYYYLEGLCES